MKTTFKESLPGLTTNHLPLTMRFARRMDVSPLPTIPYDPPTQMSIYGGDTVTMMGKDKSTCSISSSTNEGHLDFGKRDSDRRVDD